MTENLKEMKKEVIGEWLNAFPQLTEFTQGKLYKIVGSTVIGIELIKLPHVESYRPYFVVYPLWKSDVKTCLDVPTVLIEIYNRKGLQFSIPYIKHRNYFNEAVECVKNQVLISMNDSVTLKSLFEMIDNCFDDILVKSNSVQQAKLYELKLCIALFLGSQDQIQKIFNQIIEEAKNWNMQMFEIWNGKFDTWLQGLHDKIANKPKFLEQILTNKQDKKLQKLNKSELNAR